MNNGSLDLNSQTPAKYHQWAELATFISRAYEKEVDEPFLQVIMEAAPDLLKWAQSQSVPELLEGSRLLEQFLQQAADPKNRPELIEELAVEFASLFYGVGINPVNVIESVYLGEEHILYEAPYFEVVEFYRQWDYEKLQNFNEPEDHIANELDFLAFQIRSAAWDMERGNLENSQRRINAAKDFLREHLNRWALDVSQAIVNATQIPFYLSVAYFTIGLLPVLSSKFEIGE